VTEERERIEKMGAEGKPNPRAIRGRKVPGGPNGVECLRGKYWKGNKEVECLQLKAPFSVPNTPTGGTARIIVRLSD
jgi:hypothetical protein